MVLKEPKKYRQIIWLTPKQNRILMDFINKLDSDWPANSAISEVIGHALTDNLFSAKIKAAMDGQRGMNFETLRCKFCNFQCKNAKGAEIHARNCTKRPLEVMVN